MDKMELYSLMEDLGRGGYSIIEDCWRSNEGYEYLICREESVRVGRADWISFKALPLAADDPIHDAVILKLIIEDSIRVEGRPLSQNEKDEAGIHHLKQAINNPNRVGRDFEVLLAVVPSTEGGFRTEIRK